LPDALKRRRCFNNCRWVHTHSCKSCRLQVVLCRDKSMLGHSRHATSCIMECPNRLAYSSSSHSSYQRLQEHGFISCRRSYPSIFKCLPQSPMWLKLVLKQRYVAYRWSSFRRSCLYLDRHSRPLSLR